MFENSSHRQTWRKAVWSAILLLSSAAPRIEAQAAPPAAQPPAYSSDEKALAAQIAALPQEEALKAIAAADHGCMTEGLYRAIRDIGNKAAAEDPHRAILITQEAENVAARAGLPVLAADARTAQAQFTGDDGHVYESIAIFGQALEMYKAASAPPKKFASFYLARAIAELHLGDLQATIADDKEALRISRELGDEVGVARAQNGLGNALNEAGSYSEAEGAFSEALRLARAHGEKLGEAFVLNNMSMMYASQDDYPMAIQFCEQSLAIKRQVGTQGSLPTSLINLANFYHIAGRDTDANKALTEAADIGRSIHNKTVIIKATAELGIIQLEAHHPEAALKLLEESESMGPDIEDLESHVQTLNRIADAYFELKNYPQSLKFNEEAGPLAQHAGMLEQFANIAWSEGQTYFEMGQLNEARHALEQSIDAIEQMRANLTGGEANQRRFLAGRMDPYRLLAVIAAMQGDWHAALDSSEKGKGRTLLDLYTGNGLSASASLTDEERAQETRLRAKFLSLSMEADRQAGNAVTPGVKDALNAKLTTAKTELEDFRKELYQRHPELRLRRADFSQSTLADMQALIPNRQTALLEYELTPAGNYLYVLTRGDGNQAELHGYKLAFSGETLESHVRRFHSSLASRDPEFGVEAKWLYAKLLAPAHLLLKGKTSLIVVPDGDLWQVPFQALQRPDGGYVVEDASLDYVPSLAVLSALKTYVPNQQADRTLLAMGNPGGATQEQADEVMALKQLYGTRNSHTFLGGDATLGQFRKSSATADVVHVAAHGIFDDRDPMSSRMLLAPTDGNAQAGWLRAREIQAMQLRAELVVLSGCETGKGTFQDGEGILGMSWAVLAAGAHGSLASAWRVEASSTTQMMLAFHEQMLHGVNKAEALRRAETKLIHSDKYSHPFYWAAFVLMGDGA
jgi:CHAT domain-containing protein